MMKVLLLIISLILCIEEEVPLPGIQDEDLPGIIIENENVFVGPALWGYINGGADLYFEYGFEKVRAQKLIYENKRFSVDVYQMSDPEAAFGIFSISHYQCMDSSDLYSCQSPYQLQVVRDRYYFSIVNETGSPEEQNTNEKLARILLQQTGLDEYTFPDIFSQNFFRPYIRNGKVIKGRLGMENGFPAWIEYVAGMEDFTITLVPFSMHNAQGRVAVIRFEDESDFDIFLDRNEINGNREDLLYLSGDRRKLVKMHGGDQYLFIEIMEGTIFAEELLQWVE